MKTNHLWKVCVIFLSMLSLTGFAAKHLKSAVKPNHGNELFMVYPAQNLLSYTIPFSVTMTASSTLHVVSVSISPQPSGPTTGLNYTSTSTQNYNAAALSATYDIQIVTMNQRCHVTLNGQTQDTSSSGHPTVNFSNVELYGNSPVQITVVAF